MATVGTIAAIIAACVGTWALVLGIRERRHRRLAEISDLVDQLKLYIGGGSRATLSRDTTQRQLRNALSGFRTRLPKTRELARRELNVSNYAEEMALCDKASAEIRDRLS
jgi:hypothetical protein